MENIKVTKASGEMEAYDESKLRHSLASAGADQEIIDYIVSEIDEVLFEGISTQKLYREAFRLLKQRSDRTAGRYKLKEALLELGPTGYPFEQFVAELLSRLGYSTKTNEIVEGNCVVHEVDVVAEKEEDHFIVECKFHNRKDHKCNVQVPLYIQARFEDIERKLNHQFAHKNKNHHGWIVTNTRFSDDARQYGDCIGLRLLSWDYPPNKGLKDLIGRVNLHPITCLSSIDEKEKKALLKRNVVFCQQLQEDGNLLTALSIDNRRKSKILKEAAEICAFKNGE